jgi:8-oxo-dGTP diphosphatase
MREILVVAAVILRDGRVLAAQRSSKGATANLWEFPGGKVESGEDEKAALRREIEEELCLQIEVGELIGEYREPVGEVVVRLNCYWASVVGGQIQLNEHQASRWLEAYELDDLHWSPPDIPAVREIVRLLSSPRSPSDRSV